LIVVLHHVSWTAALHHSINNTDTALLQPQLMHILHIAFNFRENSAVFSKHSVASASKTFHLFNLPLGRTCVPLHYNPAVTINATMRTLSHKYALMLKKGYVQG